jgi:serralysin
MSAHDAREQYFIELVNRARMNPAGEAARLGIDLNKGVKTYYESKGQIPVYLTATPKQVLASNSYLNDSATSHSNWMLAQDVFSHTGVGGSMPWDRMVAAGYTNYANAGENIAWGGSNASYNLNTAVGSQHDGLFDSVGHRINILNDSFKEIGIGSVGGVFQGYNALMSSQNFGTSQTAGVFVTGVAYKDTVSNNNFYTIGEGQGAISAKLYSGATLLKSTTTADAGGYALKTTSTGSLEGVFSGGTAAGSVGARFTLGTKNVKVDLVNSNTIETNASVTLTRDAKHAVLLGIENKSLAGNGYANQLTGNSGKNSLAGGGGNDTLAGGKGADTLTGGSGNDKFRYYGTSNGGDHVKDFAEGDVFAFSSSAFGNLVKGAITSTIFKTGTSTSTLDSNDRFFFNTITDTLYFDSNGSGAGGNSVMAVLDNGFTLSANDILIV